MAWRIATDKMKQAKMFCATAMQRRMDQEKINRRLYRLKMKHGIYPTKIEDFKVIKGDLVEIIRGRDEGKQGRVKRVLRQSETAIVEGLNLRYGRGQGKAGDKQSKMKESPILLKNLALVDEDTGIPTPIDWKYQQLQSDKDRYHRVRQSIVSGEIIPTSKLAKPQRKLKECHPSKDTPPSWARARSWIGPWEFFTDKQREYIIEHANETIAPEIGGNIEDKLPDLIYNNVEEVQDYIRMLPYCMHTMFEAGKCPPFYYEKRPDKKWSKKRIKRNLKLPEGKREISEELLHQLEGRRTFPIYYTKKINPNDPWPRVKPILDPKFKKYHHKLREIERMNNQDINDDNDDEQENEQEYIEMNRKHDNIVTRDDARKMDNMDLAKLYIQD